MLGLLLLAVSPTLFILLYIYRKDRYEPEPLHLVAWIFFLGALSVIPAAFIELLFPEGIFRSAFVAPVVEEAIKFLIVFFSLYRHPEFDEPVDGIIYATAAGLGFATIENILYVLEGGLAVGIIRAVASVPGHVVFSCIWGFALGTARFRPEQERTGIILFGLFGAVLMHGFFNFSLEVFEVLGLLLILVVIIPLGWWMTCRNIQSAHDDPASVCSVMNHAGSLSGMSVSGPACVTPHPSAFPPLPPAPGSTGTVPADENTRHENSLHRFCTHCGAPRREGTHFCENCGRE